MRISTLPPVNFKQKQNNKNSQTSFGFTTVSKGIQPDIFKKASEEVSSLQYLKIELEAALKNQETTIMDLFSDKSIVEVKFPPKANSDITSVRYYTSGIIDNTGSEYLTYKDSFGYHRIKIESMDTRSLGYVNQIKDLLKV